MHICFVKLWVCSCVYMCFHFNFISFISDFTKLDLLCCNFLSLRFFQFVLSMVSSSFNPTLSIYLLHDSFHLVFCLPLRFFPGTGVSNILLSTCPSSLLLTCPYHFSIFSMIFFTTGDAFTDPLTCLFLILVLLIRALTDIAAKCVHFYEF